MSFDLGSLATGATARLSLDLRLADSLQGATVLDLPVRIRWNGGAQAWPQRLLVNPYPVYLPQLAANN